MKFLFIIHLVIFLPIFKQNKLGEFMYEKKCMKVFAGVHRKNFWRDLCKFEDFG